MYKFSRLFVNSVGTVCRQLTASLNTNGISPGLQRTLCSSAVQHPETKAPNTGSEQTFSYFPPLPGQESSLRWGGKKFEELPIIHIKATYNNTHIQLTDYAGKSILRTSCGKEGFKNNKKSTPIAAQTAGIAAATQTIEKGVTLVRVLIKGVGPGRQAAIKGLQMGGVEVVSITDNTPVPHNGCRPRKARRL